MFFKEERGLLKIKMRFSTEWEVKSFCKRKHMAVTLKFTTHIIIHFFNLIIYFWIFYVLFFKKSFIILLFTKQEADTDA